MLNRKDIAERLGFKTTEQLRKVAEIHPEYPKPVARYSRKTVMWEERDIDRFERLIRARTT